MSTDHNFWRERGAEADSNRGPSAYKPNALPLGQTGSLICVCTRFPLQTRTSPYLEGVVCVTPTSLGEDESRNPCSVVVVVDCFYIALFSALEQTAVPAPTWVNSFSVARFWISTEVVHLHRWHMAVGTWNCCRLGMFCVHHTTMHYATPCKTTYVRRMRI